MMPSRKRTPAMAALVGLFALTCVAACSSGSEGESDPSTAAGADTATADVEQAGKCGAKGDCNDDNPCTQDTCTEGVGCSYTTKADGETCDDGSACTSADACSSGQCIGVAKVCDDGDPCTTDLCVAGSCTTKNKASACDDGDKCTTGDKCSGGKCTGGTPKECTASGPCTTVACDPTSGACVASDVEPGGTCDDGNACTADDRCEKAVCTGTGKPCDDNLTCTLDGCDPKSGNCTHTPAQSGSPCNDGDACSQTDSCADGVCKGATTKSCGDGSACETIACNPKTGACEATGLADGATCSDSSACTVDDACQQGVCSGPAKNCDDSNACTDDACDPTTGLCANLPGTATAAACDDGDACTLGDACTETTCAAGQPTACQDAGPCRPSACDATTGKCESSTLNDGDKCSDDKACTTDDACDGGLCVGKTKDCDDQSACTADSCNDVSGGCLHDASAAKGDACDDGDACTTGDACAAGKCASGTAKVCQDAGPCVAVACDTATGKCDNKTKADGTACSDDKACTTDDVCDGGLCAGKPVTCDDNNPCTTDACDPETGKCSATALDGTGCDDGDKCTVGDSCESGKCSGGQATTCPDAGPCSEVTCNGATGKCSGKQRADGSGCTDGNACTEGDVCDGGLCAGKPVNCDDANPCTKDACDAQSGQCNVGGAATHAPDGTACDDGDKCTLSEACKSGVCGNGKATMCQDSGPCAQISCDSATGKCSGKIGANGSTCDDGKACTGPDTCDGGLCAGKPIGCDDKNPCTNDSCDTATGKCKAAGLDDVGCDDGDKCTVGERCKLGQCAAGVITTCPDSGPCSDVACDASTGKCSGKAKVDGAACNDGKGCTTGDACDGGLCAGKPVDCDDKQPCTSDSCNSATGKCVHDGAALQNKPCDDGNLCTQSDACKTGVCAGVAPSCPSAGPCATAACNGDTGKCEVTAKPDGGKCDDTKACTVSDACTGGLCAGKPKPCDDGKPCTQDRCDTKTGECVFDAAAANDQSCDDSDACTTADSCTNGACGGQKIPCDDANGCTTDVCNKSTGKCTSTAATGAKCDDSDACTSNDACTDKGACTGVGICACQADADCKAKDDGNPCNGTLVCNVKTHTCDVDPATVVKCSGAPTTDGCALNNCNPKSGKCEDLPRQDGAICSDNSKCTTNDGCTSGKCIPGKPLPCDDGKACTADSCKADKGCVFDAAAVDKKACDADGDKCTQNDACSSGVCVAGAKKLCDDGSACTADSCDKTTGSCKTTPVKDGTPCDDANACRTDDKCVTGVCKGTADKDCDDNNACTKDACAADKGCSHDAAALNNQPCDADGDKCTAGDSCKSGTCAVGNPKVCDDGSACTTDSCDKTTGACKTTPVKDGTACDDNDACKTDDSCLGGACKGTTAKDCDDNNGCTKDACAADKGCSHDAESLNNQGCDADGDKCTVGDICKSGTCAVGASKVCDDGSACTTDSCDKTSGDCKTAPVKDGTACDDNDACKTVDKCVTGVCKGTTSKDCDDKNACSKDSCDATAGCKHDLVALNDQPCDADGDKCTQNDVCKTGTCAVGAKKFCDDGEVCTTDGCDKTTGGCTTSPVADADPCDDGDKCTPVDGCVKGACVGSGAKDCDDNNACTKDTCDGASGCKNDAGLLNDKPCDADGDACTQNDVCKTGSCTVGATKLCDDNNVCTSDACNKTTGACVYTAVTEPTACDDGNVCTTGDACAAKVCKASGTKGCDDSKVCTKDACDPNVTGGCTNTADDTLTCEDGDKCTAPDACKSGVCVAGGSKDCDDDNGCTDDSCNKADGKCAHKNVADAKACDDGDKCTQDDACKEGADGISTCATSNPVNCADNNPCTLDSCAKTTGCAHVAVSPGTACDKDSDKCTADKCSGTTCAAGSTTVCDDKNPCTTDSCNKLTGDCGAVAVGDGTGCEDGSPCTKPDTCAAGTCKAGPGVVCEDNKPCTDNECTLANGCEYPSTADGTGCDLDGSKCTPDTCKSGGCAAASSKVCDDGNPCTTDSCTAATGACATAAGNDDASCDDGSACTNGDKCAAGACKGTIKVCSDGNVCTDDTCDPTAGCQTSNNAAPCDDNDACTSSEKCNAGACKGGQVVDCDDQTACTIDSCDQTTGCKNISTLSCTQPQWNVLVYMAADNNLEASALDDVQEMLAVSPLARVRFIVQLDRHAGYSDAPLSTLGNFSSTKRLLIDVDASTGKRTLKQIVDLGETNTGDAATLKDFISWGLTSYPADRTVLVLWNHGQGWRGFGGDESVVGSDWLLLPEVSNAVKQALSATKGTTGIDMFDLVGFDACLMASLPTAKEMVGTATLYVASEDVEPGHGWDYRAFSVLSEQANYMMSPTAIGKAIINGFAAQAAAQKKSSSITLALMKLNKVAAVSAAVDALTDKVGAQMKTIVAEIGASRSKVLDFGRSPNPLQHYFMVDAGDMAIEVAKRDTTADKVLGPLKDAVLNALADLIVYKTAGPVTEKATGLSLYFPPQPSYYLGDYADVSEAVKWRGTLTGFHQEAIAQGVAPEVSGEGLEGGTKAGGASASDPIPLPYRERFRCGSDTAKQWSSLLLNSNNQAVNDDSNLSLTKTRWAVDTSPADSEGLGCTLNFDAGNGVSCTAAKRITANVYSPWIGLGDLDPRDRIAIAYTWRGKADKKVILRVRMFSGDAYEWLSPSPTPTPGTNVVFVQPRQDDPDLAAIRLGFQFEVLCGSAPSGVGAVIEDVTVLRTNNVCEGSGAGSWCIGKELVVCDNAAQVDDRAECAFGCLDVGDGNALCKPASSSLTGEVKLTCDADGVLTFRTQTTDKKSTNVARARLYFGFDTSRDASKVLGTSPPDAELPDGGGRKQIIGETEAAVSSKGVITATWDQRITIARHKRGDAVLYSQLTKKAGLDHHEVAIDYAQSVISDCPCTRPSDKGFGDKDGDGWSDCIDQDVDGDTVHNDDDNCVWMANKDQKDDDGNGVGNACVVNGNDRPNRGKPSYACTPEPFRGQRPGVWHIDLNPTNGAIINQSIYLRQPYGISEIQPAPYTVLRVQEKVIGEASGGALGLSHFITGYSSPTIDTQDLPSITILRPLLRQLMATRNDGTRLARPTGEPVPLVELLGADNLYLELVVENAAGTTSSAIYRGPLPANCAAKTLSCGSGKVRDCTGTCELVSKKGDGVCHNGKDTDSGREPHFKCADHDYDDGDCSSCPAEDEARDCQGRCVPLAQIRALSRNGVCNDGSKLHFSGDSTDPHCVVGDRLCPEHIFTPRSREPDLNCTRLGYDVGDCSSLSRLSGKGSAFSSIRPCPASTLDADCNGACFDVRAKAFGPGEGDACQARFKCQEHRYDGRLCTPEIAAKCGGGITAASKCNGHGECTDYGCNCDAGWTGIGCSVRRATAAVCAQHVGNGSGHPVIDARVCATKPACCKNGWSPTCAALAAKLPDVFCTEKTGCPAGICNKGPYTDLAVGNKFVCALDASATPWCWGGNAAGGWTSADGKDQPTPTQVGIHSGVDASSQHSNLVANRWVCADAKFGTLAWHACSDTLLQLFTANLVNVALGPDHFCGIKDGTVNCGGTNRYGQLGSTHSTSGAAICAVTYAGISTLGAGRLVAAGRRHTCAVRGKLKSNTIRCIGDNRYGQTTGALAVGNPLSPVQTVGTYAHIVSIDAGDDHTCAVADGTVHCWGRNDDRQVADTNSARVKVSSKVIGLPSIKQVALGSRHSCALATNGQVWCWGANDRMQLGPWAGAIHGEPVRVKADGAGLALGTITKISAGGDTTCGLRDTGSIGCWGDNTHGQLGIGTAGDAVCTPKCDDKQCGDDGCGGSCGECANSRVCDGGQCRVCTPACEGGQQCGDDGCGGSCGTCASGQTCQLPEGECVQVKDNSTCKGNCGSSRELGDGSLCSCSVKGCGKKIPCCPDTVAECLSCKAQCTGKTCGDDGCGGTCGTCAAGTMCKLGNCVGTFGCKGRCGTFNSWDFDTLSSVNFGKGCSCSAKCLIEGNCCVDYVLQCGTYCEPFCTDRQCGDNGCGGSCGSCASGASCDADSGRCVKVDSCKGQCGVSKVSASSAAGACSCVLNDCAGVTSGPGVCCPDACAKCGTKSGCVGSCGAYGINPESSLKCSCKAGCDTADPAGPLGEVCCPDFKLACGTCVRECKGRQCGDDGCGGVCGTCESGDFCSESGHCSALDCAGRTCGPGATGGSCGTCADDDVCIATPNGGATCAAAVGCVGRCGADGQQTDGKTCSCRADCVAAKNCCAGYLQACPACKTRCAGRNCGDDGCGGSCGTCGGSKTCIDGVCAAPKTCANRCGYDSVTPDGEACSCASYCDAYGNCCPDMKEQCPATTGCKGRCGQLSLSAAGASCSCRFDCAKTGDCCSDATARCGICQPYCVNKQCGDDGCGGTCGSCPQGSTCKANQCAAQCPPGGCAGSCTEPVVTAAPVAGDRLSGTTVNGTLASARFPAIHGVAVLKDGSVVVATDGDYLRRIANGSVTTFAGGTKGYVDGTLGSARFDAPKRLAYSDTNGLAIADLGNNRVRFITNKGVVFTPPKDKTTSRLSQPWGVAFDGNDDLWVGDVGRKSIYKLQVSGKLTHIAGSSFDLQNLNAGHVDGPAESARFTFPDNLAVDANNIIWIADGNWIRRMTPDGQVITVAGTDGTYSLLTNPLDRTTQAGDGAADGAVMQPLAVLPDSAGGLLFSDALRPSIRRIDALGTITTLTGEGQPGFSPATALQHYFAKQLAAHGANVYFAGRFQVSRLTRAHACNDADTCTADLCRGGKCLHVPIPGCGLANGCSADTFSVVTHVGGTQGHVDGNANKARLSYPSDVAIGPDGTVLVSGYHAIRTVNELGDVGTLAGSTTTGTADGPGAAARFNDPHAMVWHPLMGLVVADTGNNRLRGVSADGDVTTLAGSTAGYAASINVALVKFNRPQGLALRGDVVIIADTYNHRMRWIIGDPASGALLVGTFAGGAAGHKDANGTAAQFDRPASVAVDSQGNVYVADAGNRRIRRIDDKLNVTTIAGNGLGGTANGALPNYTRFRAPYGIAIGPQGGLLVTDETADNLRWLKGDLQSVSAAGAANTAGSADGIGAAARFNNPRGIAVGARATAWIADRNNHALRRVQLPVACDDGDPCTFDDCNAGACRHLVVPGCSALQTCAPNLALVRVAGTGAAGYSAAVPLSAKFKQPSDVAIDSDDVMWVADTNNYRIRRIPGFGFVSTAVGNGTAGNVDGIGEGARIGVVRALGDTKERLFFADETAHSIRSFHKASRRVRTVWTGFAFFGTAFTGNIWGLATSTEENTLFVSDTAKHRIVPLDIRGTVAWYPAGIVGGTEGFADGAGTAARFKNPAGLDVAPSGDLYVADLGNHAIRRVTWVATSAGANKWQVTTVAGGTLGSADGVGTAAKFSYPVGIVVDAEHNLLVSDTGNHTIRRIRPDGLVSTIIGKAGTPGVVYGVGAAARLNSPAGLAIKGTNVFIAHIFGHAIARFESGECGDGARCTLDACDAASKRCTHTAISGCN